MVNVLRMYVAVDDQILSHFDQGWLSIPHIHHEQVLSCLVLVVDALLDELPEFMLIAFGHGRQDRFGVPLLLDWLATAV